MLYAQYVPTEDLVFTGADFARQWSEATERRRHYAYLIPLPGDAEWPYLRAYFSRRKFTRRELRQLCAGDMLPLVQRAAKGEDVCGFQWPLDAVTLEACSAHGKRILEALAYGHI